MLGINAELINSLNTSVYSYTETVFQLTWVSGLPKGREEGREGKRRGRPDTDALIGSCRTSRFWMWRWLGNSQWALTYVTPPEIKISERRLLWTDVHANEQWTKTSLDVIQRYLSVFMEGDDFKTAREGALQFFLELDVIEDRNYASKAACETERRPRSFSKIKVTGLRLWHLYPCRSVLNSVFRRNLLLTSFWEGLFYLEALCIK